MDDQVVCTCSCRANCDEYDTKYDGSPQAMEQVGDYKCNLYYGMRLDHMYEARRKSFINHNSLRCLRSGYSFYVVKYRKED